MIRNQRNGCFVFLLCLLLALVVMSQQQGAPVIRPIYHFIAPSLWMNDPCAPMYIESDGTFHMFYQYNPFHSYWGNMTWGHAVSKDLIFWKDLPFALTPGVDQGSVSTPYDALGVFSGSGLSVGFKGLPSIFYTAVSQLPLSWKIPYTNGAEKQAIAISNDGGYTWTKHPSNPLISSPPSGLDVTGFRDPYVFKSDLLAQQLGVPSSNTFMVVSGGERGQGGRLFLYQSADYLQWEYEGIFLGLPSNFTPTAFSGSYGFNWELANYVSLADDQSKDNISVITLGTEGARGPEKLTNWPLWMIGRVQKKPTEREENSKGATSVEFQPKVFGVLDWGTAYALNGFYLKGSNMGSQYVSFAWLYEDLVVAADQNPNGWSGCLSLPRELFILTIHGVVVPDPHASHLSVGSWMFLETKVKGLFTVKTLGSRPITEVTKLRQSSSSWSIGNRIFNSSLSLPFSSTAFELQSTFEVLNTTQRVGFVVRKGANEKTVIYVDLYSNELVVDRSLSTLQKNTYNTAIERAPFLLFNISQDGVSEKGAKRETLELRVFVDGSVVEIFVNQRTVMSTRIYPSEPSDQAELFLNGEVKVLDLKAWWNLPAVWSGRF